MLRNSPLHALACSHHALAVVSLGSCGSGAQRMKLLHEGSMTYPSRAVADEVAVIGARTFL